MDKKKSKRFPYIRIVVAAIILFLIGTMIGNIVKKQNQKSVALVELENYILHEATRKSISNELLTPAQQKAYGSYALRDFRAAKPLLSDLWEAERDTLSLYYLGISHWYSNDKSEAKKVLGLPYFDDYNKPY